MNQQEILDNLPQIAEIMRLHQVKKAYLFGSVCTQEFTEQSDVDFLISMPENMDPIQYADDYFALLEALRNYLNRDVDLLTTVSLKNPYLLKSIHQNSIKIYEEPRRFNVLASSYVGRFCASHIPTSGRTWNRGGFDYLFLKKIGFNHEKIFKRKRTKEYAFAGL